MVDTLYIAQNSSSAFGQNDVPDVRCLPILHVCRISLTNKNLKERHLIRIIWDSRVENPVFPIINEVMTLTGSVDLSS